MHDFLHLHHRIWLCILCFFLVIILLSPLPAAAAPSQTIGGKDSGMVNILLIGQDSSSNDVSRSDTIILCTFQPESGRITLTSFLRDLYVKIPGWQNNRLNAAYAHGGRELLQETLLENFGISIDGCIEADFSHFSQIIDALGGVTIDLRQDEAAVINKVTAGNLTKGTHLLNGDQALAYSRIRNLDSDGDFSRTERQRILLFSLMDRYKDAGLLTILSAVTDTLPMISTDLSKKEILLLAVKLFPLLDSPDVTDQRVPADGDYSYETIRNMNVIIADPKDIHNQLLDTLIGTPES